LGSDENSGSLQAPWRTLQSALDRLEPGGTVYLRAGVYDEIVTAGRGWSRSAPGTLKAYPGERAVLTGQLTISGDHFRVSRLVFRGQRSGRPRVLVYIEGARDVWILHNDIGGAALSGVFVSAKARDVHVLSNWIHDNGTREEVDNGISCEVAAGGSIVNNVIEGNKAFGIQLYPDCDGVLVNQNTVVENGRSGIIIGGEAATSDNNFVVNNIFAFNGEQGIRSYWGGPIGSGNAVQNNLIYGNRILDVSRVGLQYGDNFTGDPRFVDRRAGDYRLADRSPAIGQALDHYASTFDLLGRRRPQGLRPDVGAYER
jgi:parallel beta-helix repeat protein